METILLGDALEQLRGLPPDSVHACVTSPPYYNLRDYGAAGQIGMEETPEIYVDKLVELFREVRRVLRTDGTLWVNIGDSYAGSGKGRMADGTHYNKKPSKSGNYGGIRNGLLTKTTAPGCKPKDLIGIPWMLAFALRVDGWYLRQDIVWNKPNCMPESVRDRCTKSHEYIFLLSKSERYYFDAEAISEPVAGESTKRYIREQRNGAGAISHAPRFGGDKYGPDTSDETRTKSGKPYVAKPRRNKRDVWTVSTSGFRGAHFAVFPEKLIEPCILAGCPEGGTVLDPFAGSGTTGVVCKRLGRNFVGVEINPEYERMARERIAAAPAFAVQLSLAEA